MKLKLFAGLSLAALTLTAAPVLGEAAHPPGTNPVLKEVLDGQPKRYIYELEATAWFLFLPVTGKATWDVKLHDGIYSSSSRVKTTGIADIFVDYDMRLSSSGYVKENGLQSYNYISQNYDGKKNRRVEMTWGEDDVAMTATPSFGDLGFPPATPDQKLSALDPITALVNIAFEPRSAENPCGGPITTFDGKQLTRLTLNYQGETDVKTKAWRGKGYECHVSMERVAGYDEGDKGNNLSGIDGPMRIYFAEAIPNMVIPVKIVVDTEEVGRITVQTSKLQLIDTAPQEASTGGASKS
ncbi:MAG: hypothetical protein CMK07_08060 [Ponticaulis sp.]|nr:hypothetical protein [Ponticaulis sp.]